MTDKSKLTTFKAITKKYAKDIVAEYDSRNKGSYFHYDIQKNEANQGITWQNGGETLVKSGQELIKNAMLLYLPEFKALSARVEDVTGLDPIFENPLRNFRSDLSMLVESLERITEGQTAFDRDKAHRLYVKMKDLREYDGPKKIPYEVTNNIGEMALHQTRIEEIGHVCGGCIHWTCRKMDEILQALHVSTFEGKRIEFGEALTKEIISQDYDLTKIYSGEALPAIAAQEAVRRYGVKDRKLLQAVDDIFVLQAKKYAEFSALARKQEDTLEEQQQEFRNILNRVGLEPSRL